MNSKKLSLHFILDSEVEANQVAEWLKRRSFVSNVKTNFLIDYCEVICTADYFRSLDISTMENDLPIDDIDFEIFPAS